MRCRKTKCEASRVRLETTGGVQADLTCVAGTAGTKSGRWSYWKAILFVCNATPEFDDDQNRYLMMMPELI